MRTINVGLLLMTFLIFFPMVAMADDGVIDFRINPASFYLITAPGSYRLVADVTMTANLPAISTGGVSNVRIDLGGHNIIAAPGSTTEGIVVNGTAGTIFNGRISGFATGVDVQGAGRHHLHDLTVEECTGWGINCLSMGRIERCYVSGNNKNGGFGGISCGNRSIVSYCTVVANTPTVSGVTLGISGGSGCIIENNEVTDNNSVSNFVYGISTTSGGGVIIRGNVVRNGVAVTSGECIGINAAVGVTITDNVVADLSGNGVVTGISSTTGALIERNNVYNLTCNSGSNAFGITAGNGSNIRANTINEVDNDGSGSAYGISATFSNIESNSCNGITEGPTGGGIAVGINAGGSIIRGNNCYNNTASTAGATDEGNAYGILAGSDSLIQENRCQTNTARGSGFNGAGISVSSRCRVVDNLLTGNSATNSAVGHGIRVTGGSTVIADNQTAAHSHGGMVILAGATNIRSERNRFNEIDAIDLGNGIAPIVGSPEADNPVTGDNDDIAH